jgi:psp operon transcriptional activator
VLLIGERGTGKELAASRLHFLSDRWEKPFITLNCATLSPALIEAELFGYEKGAFTGAGERRHGRFETADGGTLFLDEIGSIPMEAQEKILRVVEYGSFERVGSSRPVEVDVRIIGATNVDLSAMAARKDFKRDLLDRLSFEVLFLPPLRYRGEDVLLLATHFANRMAFELGRKNIPVFTEKVVKQLEAYQWRGNIRELKNVIERAVYRCEGDVIGSVNFDPFISPFEMEEKPENDRGLREDSLHYFSKAQEKIPFKKVVSQLEITLLRKGLEKAGNNQKKAAILLDLTYDQFRGLLRKYKRELDR